MGSTRLPSGIRIRGGSIEIRFNHKGREICEVYPGSPAKKADIAAAAKHSEWLKSRLNLGLSIRDDEPGAIRTFAEVAQEYLNCLDVKSSTAVDYLRILNRYWIPALGDMPVTEIRRQDVKAVLAQHKISVKTKRNILGPLRQTFEHAEVQPNPAALVRFRKQQKEPVDRYRPKERAKLLSKLEGQPLVYFSLLFGTGLRPGEALGLLWTDYDGEELSISKQISRRKHVPSTKTSMRRTVYVPTWTRECLNKHTTRFRGGHIFKNTEGGPYLDTDVFNDAWREAHRKARLRYRIPYVCRHTRAAELLSIGISPPDAAKQLGHSTEMFMRTYSEFIEEYAGHQDKSRFEGVGINTLTVEK